MIGGTSASLDERFKELEVGNSNFCLWNSKTQQVMWCSSPEPKGSSGIDEELNKLRRAALPGYGEKNDVGLCDIVARQCYCTSILVWNLIFFTPTSYLSGQSTKPIMELPQSNGNDNLKFELEQMKKEIATELWIRIISSLSPSSCIRAKFQETVMMKRLFLNVWFDYCIAYSISV